MSRYMVLKLPDEMLVLSRPLPPPAPPGTPLFPEDLQAITLPAQRGCAETGLVC